MRRWLLLLLLTVMQEEEELGVIDALDGAREPIPTQLSYKYPSGEWSLDNEVEENVRYDTRFTKDQLKRLAGLLLGEDDLRFASGRSKKHYFKASPVKALYLVCQRMAYPGRYYSLRLGKHHSWLSNVFNGTVELLYKQWRDHLKWWPALNDIATLERYGRIAGEAGHGGGLLWGFIDGTFFEYARPKDHQKQLSSYAGYYGANGEKVQCITTPDGLVVHTSEAFLGPANDWTMYEESGVEARLRLLFEPRGAEMYLYGDSAYQSCYGIIDPFRADGGWRYLTDEQARANYWHSKSRIGVEMAFGDNWKYWTYANAGKMLRSSCQPTSAYRQVSFLLQNCLLCMRYEESGRLGAIGKMFECPPPTLEQYLTGQGVQDAAVPQGDEEDDG